MHPDTETERGKPNSGWDVSFGMSDNPLFREEKSHGRPLPGDLAYKVMGIKDLSESTYVLRFERKELDFEPGQHILLGEPGKVQMREYSIYSGKCDPYLEVLIREVKNGLISRRLRKLRPGDTVKLEPPATTAAASTVDSRAG